MKIVHIVRFPYAHGSNMATWSSTSVLMWAGLDRILTAAAVHDIAQYLTKVLCQCKSKYRASQYRLCFVHPWLFLIRNFKIQISILKEHRFSSNILFVSSKSIVYFWRYDLFSKNPWNCFFSKDDNLTHHKATHILE